MAATATAAWGLIRCQAQRAHPPEERALSGPTDERPGLAPEEFGALFERHSEDVRRVCLRLLGRTAGAEDAAHETFLKARRALEGYDGRRAFRPWLLAIASNHCIDQLRRGRTEQRIFAPLPEDGLPLAAPGASPLRGVLDGETRRDLLERLDALPERYRAPLVLRYLADLDPERIAEILEVSRPQVATLLYRGRCKLRATFAAPREEGT